MKRLYACLLIAAAILALAAGGRQTVQGFSAEMEAGLSAVEQAADRQDAAAAAQAADACLAALQRREPLLSVFVRRDYLTQLDETLRMAQQYARQALLDEAQAECGRARGQVEGIRRLFFRML